MANSRQTKPSDEHRLLRTDHKPFSLFEEAGRRARRCPPREPSGCQIGRYDSQRVIAAISMPTMNKITCVRRWGLHPAALNLPATRFALSARCLARSLEGSAHRSRRHSTSRCGRRSGWPNSPRKNAAFCRRCATRARRRATRGARLRSVSHPNRRRCRGKPKTPCPSQDAQLHPQKRHGFAKVGNSCAKTRNSRRKVAVGLPPEPPPLPWKAKNAVPQARLATATPKNAAFLRRCATRARRRATRQQGRGRSPGRATAAVAAEHKNALPQPRRATATPPKTPRFCEDAQLAPEDAQLATYH